MGQEHESGLELKHLPALAEYLGIHFTPIGSMKPPLLPSEEAERLAAGIVEGTKPIKVKDFMDTLNAALAFAEKPDGQST